MLHVIRLFECDRSCELEPSLVETKNLQLSYQESEADELPYEIADRLSYQETVNGLITRTP